ADGAGDRVLVLLVRRAVDVLALEPAAADELVDQGVIFGELVGLALAHEVDARIADVGDEPTHAAGRASAREQGAGGAHAALLRLGLGAVVDDAARVLHRVLEDLEDLHRRDRRVAAVEALDEVAVLVQAVAQLVDRERRRDLSRGVAAHAVGDDEQTELLVDEEVILVVVALAPDVRRGPVTKLHHFRSAPWGGRANRAWEIAPAPARPARRPAASYPAPR